MNRTENNILIAEFMGYKLMSCNRGKAWDIGKSIPSKDHLFPIQGVLHTGNELKFHTSWDWLIPVIENIDHLQHEPIASIENALSTRSINDTYNEVVKFIKKHNNN